MKRLPLLLLLLLPLTFSFAQKKEKGKYMAQCKVFYLLDEKIGSTSDGVVIHYQQNIPEFMYKLDDADIYLVRGNDTLAHKKSFDGEVIFKNLNPGKYEVIYTKKGYNTVKKEIVIIDQSVKSSGNIKELPEK